MVRQWKSAALALLIGAGLVGCSETPSAPDLDSGAGDPTDLSANAEMELQVAGDEVVAEIVVEDAVLSLESPPDGAGTPFADARACFAEARELLRGGDEEGAKAKAVECRTALVAAMIDLRGEEVVDELFGRVETLLEWLGLADDEFERVTDLEARVQDLFDEATVLRDEGDLVGAGERLLLALQMADRMRHRHHDFIRDRVGFARLAIARAVEAIQLAKELIPDPTFRQEAVLFHAQELLRRAQFAFDHGLYRRAVVLARRAEGRALFAVLEFEPPTVEEAVAILQLTDRVIDAAREAVGEDPTPLQEALLQRSVRLRNAGAEAINTWHWRGVGLLWHATVTAAILLPPSGA